MKRITVGIGSIGDALRQVVADALREDADTIRGPVLEEVALRAEARAVDLTTERGKVDRGEMRRGWSKRATADGWDVGNDAPHAPTVELGRRPNRPGPPRAPIEEWVRRKMQGGDLTPDEGETVEQAVRRLTFLIRRKIHREGIEPTHILRDTVDDVPEWLDDAIRRHLG